MARMAPQVLGRRLGLANVWGVSAAVVAVHRSTQRHYPSLHHGLETGGGLSLQQALDAHLCGIFRGELGGMSVHILVRIAHVSLYSKQVSSAFISDRPLSGAHSVPYP